MGQYTFKIFHIERHLPGWFKAILPSNAMKIEEESWNAIHIQKHDIDVHLLIDLHWKLRQSI